MNLPATPRRLALAVALLPAAASAQTAPATPPPPPPDDTVTLSAFEVTSARDVGYRVQNAVATTGIAQALIDTPLPITVVTEEFLRDAGLRGFTGAVAYVSSISTDPHAGNGNYAPGIGSSQGNMNRFRGQPVNGTFRNGLRLTHGFDTDNVDRIEVAKGPLAVFVGGATLGGEVNVVTKQPRFAPFHELTLSAGSHDTFSAAIDSTGAINAKKTFAYRLLASYRDANTWRDHSDTQTRYLSPQLLWRPNPRLNIRLDYAHRLAEGNLVSQNVSDTSNYQADFDQPRPLLLELGRTTALGRPYTENEYRTRIGQAFGNWRQDVFDATGRWVTLGEGLGLLEGNFPGGRAANSYGPHADFVERTDLLELDATLAATEWLQAHVIGRQVKAYVSHPYFSFSQRLMPAGSYNLTSGYQGRRLHDESREAKLETVLKASVWRLDGTLLVGGQYGESESYNENAIFDYSGLAAVAGSPNVFGSPATLTGANILNFFDPRVHPFPDNRAFTRWPSATAAPGTQAYTGGTSISRAAFAAASVDIFERVIVTGGFRRSWLHAISQTLDRNLVPLTGTANGNPSTDNHTLGVVVRLRPGLNLYASRNQGETVRTGSLVGRVTFGVPLPPLDIVTPAEQAANPVPNAIGKGKEAGLKFELFDRKLTGSIGWFELVNGNIIVTDNDRNAADPRNVGTEVDPNPATADPGRRLQVNWTRPIDGNTTEGVETDLVWTPTPNYSMVFAASHLFVNKVTVARAATADPTTQRTYLILNGRELDNSPNWMVRAFQQYRFTGGALRGGSVGLGVRYQSEQSPTNSDANWGLEFGGYTVVDLQLGYGTRLGERPVHFQLGVTNLLDRDYITGNRVFGAPREFTFTTRLQF